MSENTNETQDLFSAAVKAAGAQVETPSQPPAAQEQARPETEPQAQAQLQEVALDPRLKSLLEQDAERTRALATANDIISRLTKPEEKPAPQKSPRSTKSWGSRLKEIDPNVDLGRIAEELWHEYTNYEKAPAEIKARREMYDANSATEELRNELANELNEVRQAQEAMLRKTYFGEVASEMKAAPADKFPNLSKLAQAKPQKAVELAMNLADKVFAEEQRGITPTELVDMCEKYIANVVAELGPVLGSPEPTKQTEQIPQSLFPKHTTNQPPLKKEDEEDVTVLRRKALEAANFPIDKARTFWGGKGY
jgi:hypothetical protein